MASFNKPTQFIYNPNANQDSENAFSGILEIHVHHARNIHNICIYDNQDVYAKFSLTYDPDETLSTRIVNGGGKNPEFNEELVIKINQADAVLKCEIWMMSRAKSYMDDQLLGFALVPISSLVGKGKVTKDFDLSSTDLFHSPAGTIRLSLSLNTKTALSPFDDSVIIDPSATSELLLDKRTSEDYCRIEFPDINIVHENQQMVSRLFAKNGTLSRPWLPDGSFLHLGAAPELPVEDYEMTVGNSDDSASPDGSILSSSMTSLSDDRNSGDSLSENKSRKDEFEEENEPDLSGKVEKSKKEGGKNHVKVKVEAEESSMQQQIVDMYMRSMNQFTESLAKMKLPMDLDKPIRVEDDDDDDLIRKPDEKIEIDPKKDNCRVFYGSRAFF